MTDKNAEKHGFIVFDKDTTIPALSVLGASSNSDKCEVVFSNLVKQALDPNHLVQLLLQFNNTQHMFTFTANFTETKSISTISFDNIVEIKTLSNNGYIIETPYFYVGSKINKESLLAELTAYFDENLVSGVQYKFERLESSAGGSKYSICLVNKRHRFAPEGMFEIDDKLDVFLTSLEQKYEHSFSFPSYYFHK